MFGFAGASDLMIRAVLSRGSGDLVSVCVCMVLALLVCDGFIIHRICAKHVAQSRRFRGKNLKKRCVNLVETLKRRALQNTKNMI